MNGVPGVIALLSQAFLPLSSSVTVLPMAARYQHNANETVPYNNVPSHIAMASRRESSFSFASWAERNRRDRCWFIFARGATPSEIDESQALLTKGKLFTDCHEE